MLMNQTIGAVRNGDKSRFLSLCYRSAAPAQRLRLTLAPKKHGMLTLLVLTRVGRSAAGRRVAAAHAVAHHACQATQQSRSRGSRLRMSLIEFGPLRGKRAALAAARLCPVFVVGLCSIGARAAAGTIEIGRQ